MRTKKKNAPVYSVQQLYIIILNKPITPKLSVDQYMYCALDVILFLC